MTAARDLDLEMLRLEWDDRRPHARHSSPPLDFASSALMRDLDQLTWTVDRDGSIGATVLAGGIDGRFL